MTDLIAQARSFLFVPAVRPDRVAKALASGADAVIIDLEDAVDPGEKEAARHALAGAFGALDSPRRARLLVRVNAAGTPWFAGDVALVNELAAQGLAGVTVPKAESAAALATFAPALGLLPLVESVNGHAAALELARAPRVVRLAFGNLDFQADAGMACDGADEPELLPVRLDLVLASRRAGIAPPVDGVVASTGDAALITAAAHRARRLGFGGKLCIHPDQVAPVHAAFTPDPAQLDWARRVLAAARTQGGAFRLDGRMVDAPVIRLAQRVVAAAR